MYYSRYRNASATTDDLRLAMQDACYAAGNCPQEDQDLSWFFDEWLNRGGIMRVTGRWHYDSAAKQLQVTLDQAQVQGIYRMPVEIAVTLPRSAPSMSSGVSNGPSSSLASAPRTATQQRESDATVQKFKLLVDKEHDTLNIPLDVAPLDVRLDPNTWLPMMEASFEKR